MIAFKTDDSMVLMLPKFFIIIGPIHLQYLKVEWYYYSENYPMSSLTSSVQYSFSADTLLLSAHREDKYPTGVLSEP